MTIETTGNGTSKQKWGKLAIMMGSGAVAGFFGAFGTLKLVDSGALGVLDTSREIALLVALLYFVMGLAVGLGTLSPKAGARFLNVEDADELREMRQSLLSSGVGCVALGGVLAVIALAGADRVIPNQTSAVIAAVLLVIAIIFSFRSAKHSDELMRAVSKDTASTGYYAVFVVIGGWVALSVLEFVPAPQMIDILTLLWALILGAAFFVCGARGMLMPR